MATAKPKPPSSPKPLTQRQELARGFFTAMLSGPYAVTVLTSTSPDAIESAVRLSLKCADVFLKVSES